MCRPTSWSCGAGWRANACCGRCSASSTRSATWSSDLNAFTSDDMTGYFINVPANKLELWCWMESERLLRPVFREFYSERDVVFRSECLHERRHDRLLHQCAGQQAGAVVLDGERTPAAAGVPRVLLGARRGLPI